MDKGRILEYAEQLLADIFLAQSCLSCQKELSSRIVNGEKILHADFFYLARSSFIYTGTMILCKAFEDDDRNSPFSIFKILIWLSNTVKLNKEQKATIANFETELARLSPIIEKLKTQRDKFYAHNDKQLIDADCIEKLSTLTQEEKENLIWFSIRFLSYVIGVCENNNDQPTVLQKDLSATALKSILRDLNQYHNAINQMKESYHKNHGEE